MTVSRYKVIITLGDYNHTKISKVYFAENASKLADMVKAEYPEVIQLVIVDRDS